MSLGIGCRPSSALLGTRFHPGRGQPDVGPVSGGEAPPARPGCWGHAGTCSLGCPVTQGAGPAPASATLQELRLGHSCLRAFPSSGRASVEGQRGQSRAQWAGPAGAALRAGWAWAAGRGGRPGGWVHHLGPGVGELASRPPWLRGEVLDDLCAPWSQGPGPRFLTSYVRARQGSRCPARALPSRPSCRSFCVLSRMPGEVTVPRSQPGGDSGLVPGEAQVGWPVLGFCPSLGR